MGSPQRSRHAVQARPFRYDATGLRGKRMRLAFDAGTPSRALTAAADVICIDDTPNMLHDLRVHPVDRPGAVLRVDFRQLEVYDHQP